MMSKTFEGVYSTMLEKDEHKKSKEYKQLSPKMRKAVDEIFKKMDAKPSDFLNTFEKTMQEISKKFKVPEKELMNYFEKEMLSI
tara:strand:+ start:3009 stop:3260 length:252 start_codon:yes stop_codon:yes gene_type:complete